MKPEPQFPYRVLQVIRPRPAEPGALLGEHAGDLVDPLEVAVAEAVQPVADLRLQLEAVQLPVPVPVAHAGHGTDGRRHRVRRGECNDRTRIAGSDGGYAVGAGFASQNVTGPPATVARTAERPCRIGAADFGFPRTQWRGPAEYALPVYGRFALVKWHRIVSSGALPTLAMRSQDASPNPCIDELPAVPGRVITRPGSAGHHRGTPRP